MIDCLLSRKKEMLFSCFGYEEGYHSQTGGLPSLFCSAPLDINSLWKWRPQWLAGDWSAAWAFEITPNYLPFSPDRHLLWFWLYPCQLLPQASGFCAYLRQVITAFWDGNQVAWHQSTFLFGFPALWSCCLYLSRIIHRKKSREIAHLWTIDFKKKTLNKTVVNQIQHWVERIHR